VESVAASPIHQPTLSSDRSGELQLIKARRLCAPSGGPVRSAHRLWLHLVVVGRGCVSGRDHGQKFADRRGITPRARVRSRLSKLVDEGSLERDGSGRAHLYRVVEAN
jgi:hypothetical protein